MKISTRLQLKERKGEENSKTIGAWEVWGLNIFCSNVAKLNEFNTQIGMKKQDMEK
jgi:hypothetical protein